MMSAALPLVRILLARQTPRSDHFRPQPKWLLEASLDSTALQCLIFKMANDGGCRKVIGQTGNQSITQIWDVTWAKTALIKKSVRGFTNVSAGQVVG